MENLPALCLKKVFDYQPNLNEQIRCSLTCKKWRAAFQLFKPNTLCLYADNYLPFQKRFSYTNERFTNSNSFSVSWFEEFLASEVTRSYFGHIKKLAFYKVSDVNVCDKYGVLPKFEFARQLNHFRELEYLEMKNEGAFVFSLKDRVIDLPKLEVLSLDLPFTNKETFEESWEIGGFEDSPIILNTPSLRTFMGRVSDFKFLFPNQLRHLELVHIKCLPIKLQQKFPNLECLMLNLWDLYSEESDPKIVSDEVLSSLARLKFLIGKINDDSENWNSEKSPRSPTLTKQVAELNDLQTLLFRSGFLDFRNWRQYTKFFGQIDHLSDFVSVDPNYNPVFSLSNLMKCEIPSHYLSGYLQIYQMEIGKDPIDQSLLLKLLKSSSYIHLLWISLACPLEQSFFNHLPDCLSVDSLSFDVAYGDDPGLCRIRDFKFLKRLAFKRIAFSVYREQFSYDLIFNLLKNETCLSISLTFENFTRVRDRCMSYKKKKSHKSLFREFDCPKCLQSTGETYSFGEIKQHVEEHLAIENVDDGKRWPSHPFRKTPFNQT